MTPLITALQARAQAVQVKTADVTSAIDQVLGLLPTAMRIVGFVLLLMLVIKAAKSWRTLGTMELAAIVIAFALVGGGR